MYETCYGLRCKPFSLLPDPTFLFLGGKYKTAVSVVEFGVWNEAAFIVVTGEPGTGKTTLLRKMIEDVRGQHAVGFLANLHRACGPLLPWVLSAFQLEPPGSSPIEGFQRFSTFVREQSAQGRRTLLIVDEAQNLSEEQLEELRILSNINLDPPLVLQIILAGQPVLREVLSRCGQQLVQRVAVDYTLTPLQEHETCLYIKHRLQVAGGGGDLFVEEAMLLVHRLSGGIPRLINQLCDMAMMYGYAEQKDRIDLRLVADAASDRQAQGIIPLAMSVEQALHGLKEILRQPEPQRYERPLTDSPPIAVGQVSRPDDFRSPHVTNGQTVALEASFQVLQPAAVSDQKTQSVPEKTLKEWLDKGVALRRAQRFKDALSCFERAATAPELAREVHAQMGLTYRSLGRLADAVASFERAVHHDSVVSSQTVAIHYALGRTLEDLGEIDRAQHQYQQVSNYHPEFRDVCQRLTNQHPPQEAAENVAVEAPSAFRKALHRVSRLLLNRA